MGSISHIGPKTSRAARDRPEPKKIARGSRTHVADRGATAPRLLRNACGHDARPALDQRSSSGRPSSPEAAPSVAHDARLARATPPSTCIATSCAASTFAR
ncbi:hypothetical protein F511_27691 [Dorcoceras hygrometricum]|uniref:Uncharacterized protein n=1 Tax=Dorcoceras hygrometricum TaxID=472368 RepID=A0A2Z7CJ06_9LAMI|nr:hypothetical protein F511_27691 [Dorcoceras hygrometricum]